MPALAKRIKAWKDKLPPGKQYPVDDALKLVKEFAKAKFNESVDAAINLGIAASLAGDAGNCCRDNRLELDAGFHHAGIDVRHVGNDDDLRV